MGASVGKKASSSRDRGQLMSDINVTPLVDVMLVLLIIFMITAPMITSGINVDLPESNAAPVRTDTKPLEITVDKSGKIYIASAEVAEADVLKKLEAIHEKNPDKIVFVKGDQSVNYGLISSVMGDINAAGFTKITLLTQGK
jgi:biopolymer transport protein TolR